MNNEIDCQLLEILACPKCRKDLQYLPKTNELQCLECNLSFQINDNIPNLIIDEARKIKD